MNEENVANRLKVFMEESGLSISQFADACGIARPSLSQLLTGRNKKINNIVLGQIHEAYPSLSVSWLLFGEGCMIVDEGKDDGMVGCLAHGQDELGHVDTVSGHHVMGNRIDNCDNSASENPELRTIGRGGDEFSKENVLNYDTNASQNIINKNLNLTMRIHELEAQISKMKKNPRRVVQVTIYYDDSTFETFIPSSGGNSSAI